MKQARYLASVFLAVCCGIGWGQWVAAQVVVPPKTDMIVSPKAAEAEEKVLVVQLNHNALPDPNESYKTELEVSKRIEVELTPDNPLANVTEANETDEKLPDGGCFIPTIKLVYDDYTYVLSTFCTSVRKFKNIAPFVTGAEVLPNDFVFTDAVLNYLEQLHTKHFKPDYKEIYHLLALNYVAASIEALNLAETGEQQMQDANVGDDLSDLTKDDDDVDSTATEASKPVMLDDDDDDAEDADELDKATEEAGTKTAPKPGATVKPKSTVAPLNNKPQATKPAARQPDANDKKSGSGSGTPPK